MSDLSESRLAEFYEAFSPLTYGNSMGRAADHALYAFDSFSQREKERATEWFYGVLNHPLDYFAAPYLYMAFKMDDPRFVPLLQAYYKRLKRRHKRPVKTKMNGEWVTIRPNFSSNLRLCKRVIRHLKRRR